MGGFIGEGRKGGARGWSEMAGRRRSMKGKKETYEGGNFVVPEWQQAEQQVERSVARQVV